MRFRVCTECRARVKPKEGRYCYLNPVAGHRRWDFVCNRCRQLIRSEERATKRAETKTEDEP